MKPCFRLCSKRCCLVAMVNVKLLNQLRFSDNMSEVSHYGMRLFHVDQRNGSSCGITSAIGRQRWGPPTLINPHQTRILIILFLCAGVSGDIPSLPLSEKQIYGSNLKSSLKHLSMSVTMGMQYRQLPNAKTALRKTQTEPAYQRRSLVTGGTPQTVQ